MDGLAEAELTLRPLTATGPAAQTVNGSQRSLLLTSTAMLSCWFEQLVTVTPVCAKLQ